MNGQCDAKINFEVFKIEKKISPDAKIVPKTSQN